MLAGLFAKLVNWLNNFSLTDFIIDFFVNDQKHKKMTYMLTTYLTLVAVIQNFEERNSLNCD